MLTKYHTIISINHIHNVPIEYGTRYFNDLNNPTPFLSWLYNSIYAKNITKYAITGVNPYVIDSPALNINCANSGVIPEFISTGTDTEDNIDHL